PGHGSPRDAAGREFAHIADALAARGLRGGSRLDERMLDLLATLLTDATGDAGALDEARALISEHHRDPGLTASRIARRVGLSERHLSRLFAEAGHSVPQT
ncbi:AraC family transcriptional regulator, partial [Burkholderia multivorans]